MLGWSHRRNISPRDFKTCTVHSVQHATCFRPSFSQSASFVPSVRVFECSADDASCKATCIIAPVLNMSSVDEQHEWPTLSEEGKEMV